MATAAAIIVGTRRVSRRAAAAAPESLLRYSDLKADVVRALVARARAERGPG